MKIEKVNLHGNPVPMGEFRDLSGLTCTVQQSSVATIEGIWLGPETNLRGGENQRMHLSREMVADILPHLQRFVATGELK